MRCVVWALDAPDSNAPEVKRLTMIKDNLRKFAKPIGVTITDSGVEFVAAPQPPHNESAAETAANFHKRHAGKSPDARG